MSSARAELERLIKQTEEELRALKSALRALERRELGSQETGRFMDMRPIDAARIVLAENGNRMLRSELEQALMDGGIAVRKKRPHHNVRLSLHTNLKLGNLCQHGDWIEVINAQAETQRTPSH